MRLLRIGNNRGQTIIGALVGLTLAAAGGKLLVSLLSSAQRGISSAATKIDIQTIEVMLNQQLSCPQSLNAPSINLSTICQAPSMGDSGPKIPLRDKKGNVINPLGKIGNFQVEASCINSGSPSTPSFDFNIIAKDLRPSCQSGTCFPYLLHSSRILNYNCAPPNGTCPTGSVMVGLNVDGSPNCAIQTASRCPIGQYMVGLKADGTIECEVNTPPFKRSMAFTIPAANSAIFLAVANGNYYPPSTVTKVAHRASTMLNCSDNNNCEQFDLDFEQFAERTANGNLWVIGYQGDLNANIRDGSSNLYTGPGAACGWLHMKITDVTAGLPELTMADLPIGFACNTYTSVSHPSHTIRPTIGHTYRFQPRLSFAGSGNSLPPSGFALAQTKDVKVWVQEYLND